MLEKIKKYYVYILIFITFLIIGLFVPIGGDDWEIASWYNDEGLFGLLCKSIYTWHTFNGRIMNNFFDMFLGKYPILWSFASAGFYTATAYILLKAFKAEKNIKAQWMIFILYLTVSPNFRQEIQLHKIANISYTIPTFFIH